MCQHGQECVPPPRGRVLPQDGPALVAVWQGFCLTDACDTETLACSRLSGSTQGPTGPGNAAWMCGVPTQDGGCGSADGAGGAGAGPPQAYPPSGSLVTSVKGWKVSEEWEPDSQTPTEHSPMEVSSPDMNRRVLGLKL